MNRKEMKRRARKSLKKHYILFVAVCLFAAFLGGEFAGSLEAFHATTSVVEASEGVPGSLAHRQSLPEVIGDLLKATGIPAFNLEGAAGEENPILGTSRGVFAYIERAAVPGSSDFFLTTLLSSLTSLLGSEGIALVLLVLLALLGIFAVWFLLQNMCTAISRRIFLEGRVYEKVPAQRFLFFLRVKKWVKVAWTMLLTSLFRFLWSLTIVGGIVKHYSYFLVPYIVAENPDIKGLDAISLSRRIMRGHKWECFLFELTFLGWEILGIFSLGLTAIFYSNPYKISSFSEYYASLRGQAMGYGIADTELLGDRYLFEKPEASVIAASYSDIIELMKKPVETMAELTGFRGFLARNFGILLSNSPKEQAYEQNQAEQILLRARKDMVEGLAYPERLSPIPEKEKRPKVETSHYLRHYSIWSLLAMFFLFSFVGWLWEVMLHLVVEHELVNRGMLHGPWLPIYGSGGVLILVLLHRLRSRPALEFASAVVLCGLVEYFTSYVTELTHNGQRWWDYSGYFLNLNGRICGEGLLVFGLGGMLVVYLLAPQLDNLLRRISGKVLIPVCLCLVFLFVGDQIYSSGVPNAGRGITEETASSQAVARPSPDSSPL